MPGIVMHLLLKTKYWFSFQGGKEDAGYKYALASAPLNIDSSILFT
jgi:hypothetical protein